MLARLATTGDPPAAADQQALARWSGWGALPGVFDDTDDRWAPTRTRLRGLLSDAEWTAARRSTLNAHYTDPSLVATIWALADQLGFGDGRVLEPGCGSGTFLGLAPDRAGIELVGVELEPITARIAQHLYPHSQIRAEGFEHSRFAEASFDLVVGNVPFGKVALHDPVHNHARHSIHNYFLIKALHLTRPGGLVLCLTSRFTLDARNPAARRELAALGDLVGAVRLPNGAHRATAGTDVITDLLVLRRRPPDATPAEVAWERTTMVDTASGPVEINEYFADRPDLVVGDLGVERGVYNDTDLTVRLPADTDLAARFADAAAVLARDAAGRGLTLTLTPRSDPSPTPATAEPVAANGKEGSLHVSGTGLFHRIVDGRALRYEPAPKTDRDELVALLAVRDAVLALLDIQARTGDDTAFADAQRLLNVGYDTYTARFGPLNRYRLARTGHVDPDTGADRYRRVFPRMGGFGVDPDYQTVLALEHFDPDTQTATKADIFTTRILGPRPPRLGADSAAEALAITLDTTGTADLARIAQLLGVTADAARAELGTLVYDDPASGRLEPAERYLAGDVRTKLRQADAAAATDPRYRLNVEALTVVVPDDLGPTEIDARLGAPWIPVSDIEAFAAEVLAADSVLIEHAPVTATWAVTASTWHRRTVTATSEFGTARADAISLLDASLNQRAATVYDTLDDGARVTNPAETLAAREKQDALETRFAAWLWEHPERAARLAGHYNELFNSVVLPRYDGRHLTLPGLAATFDPHQHQRDAVWRILSAGDTLLAHAVGAGKTATMVIAGMELRRLALAAKPAYVVPNHMLEQFARELLQLYPQARLLVATRDDMSAAGRKRFVARCATGDWDAVVLTHSAFERIPLSAATRAEFLGERIGEYRAAATASANGKGLTVKRLEAMIARLEERHAQLQAAERKDDGATFEQSGIDFLFVDEAHAYKNRPFPTRIQGVGGQGSHRAEDLDVKLWWLRRHHDRAACLATATPIANTVAEMYVTQTYLQPATLATAGIDQFDAWAATFGATVTALELAPDGASYRMTTRFARYRNVPELLTLFRQIADVRTTDQLALPTPQLAGGKPETVIVAASAQLTDYVTTLAERADAVRNRRVDPTEDNMLKISGDGRRAALDLRLVERPRPRRRQDRRRRRTHRRHPPRHPSAALPRPRRPTVRPARRPAARLLRPVHPQPRPLERLRPPPYPARRPRRTRRPDPIHPRRRQRPRQSRPLRRLPRRPRRRPRRLHRQDGHRHQRPGPRHRAAPPRLPLAARGPRTTRRTPAPPRQPEPRSPRPALRHRRLVRHLHVADRRTESRVHQPSHARHHRRPRDRRHRRPSPLLRRSQSPRHRQPPHHGKSRHRQRRRPPPTPP